MAFSTRRILTIIARNLTAETHNPIRTADTFFWPLLDFVLWGAGSLWLTSAAGQDRTLAQILMTGLVLWHVVVRAMFEISVGLIEEVWNRSLVNLFATPLTLWEWMCATMTIGSIKSLIILFFGAGITKLFFGINILSIGFILMPSFFLLLMFGWSIGFVGASMVIHAGNRVGSLPWILAYICTPFCAVYCPVEMLPLALQYFARSLPVTYVFENLRSLLTTGSYAAQNFSISLALSIIWLSLTLYLFRRTFQSSLKKGLSRLE